jgi:hypothetical protein
MKPFSRPLPWPFGLIVLAARASTTVISRNAKVPVLIASSCATSPPPLPRSRPTRRWDLVDGGAAAYRYGTGEDTIEAAGKRTADEIAAKLRPKFQEQGWI